MTTRVHTRRPYRSRLHVLALLVGALSMVLASTAVASPQRQGPPAGVVVPDHAAVVADSYIVVLDTERPGSVAFEHARRWGAEVGFVYEHAVTGYAATMSARAAQAIARDPRVVRVEQESMETITAQELPTGVDRIETDRNPNVSTDGTGGDVVAIDVAVLDTGVNNHPDLNLATSTDCTVRSGGGPFASYSCQAGTDADDTNGHGTHVAGTVAARNNGSGVVGVAPGAPVHSVKVCPGNSCPTGSIIAGIDHLVEQKQLHNDTDGDEGIDLAVANFSISSADSDNSCASPANTTHQAICSLVGEGVSFVMAAGNDGREKVPYPVALSVSAIADFDGVAGGAGEPTCRDDDDDTLANFSNFGDGVRIAAPGVCILSTWFDGGYNTISGTSMAAPHAAGAYALYLHANGFAPATDADGVLAIEDAIIGAALPQGTNNNECSYDDARPGGPLLFVNAEAFGGTGSCGVAGEDDGSTEPDPDPEPEPDPDPEEPEEPTATFTVSCDELQCTFDASTSNVTGQATYSWNFGDDSSATGEQVAHSYTGDGTYTVTLIVEDDGGQDTSTQQVSVAADGDDGDDGEDPGDIELSLDPYKVRGLKNVDLSWSGAEGPSVDIRRDGGLVATVDNTGAYTDPIGTRGGGSYAYEVCEAGTSTCSPTVIAEF